MNFLKPFLRYTNIPSRESKYDEVQKFVYRDELNKKQAPVKVKKRVHFESKDMLQSAGSKKISEKDGISSGVAINGEKSPGIQVKILMRKEEAVRLLSKCKDGGILEFKDVANELARIPNNRVDIVSSSKKDK